MSKQLKAWLQLVRAPNLFTVPGDPLAGLLLACGPAALSGVTLLKLLPISLLVYSGGLILNDIADLEHDRKTRPNRPLPSGAIKIEQARVAAILCLVIALGCAFSLGQAPLIGTLLLIVMVWLYNFVVKEVPVVGAIAMGACRACSVGVGASVCFGSETVHHGFMAAAGIGIYIVFVTELARGEEMAEIKHRILPWSPQPKTIGLLISLLLPIQAILMLLAGAYIPAVVFLLMWPISRKLAKRFYAS